MGGERPTFSVIVPTLGRHSLSSSIASAAQQLEPGDEILVLRNEERDFGAKARNDAMARAKGSHLLFLDDDDEYLPGAFGKLRRFAAENPGRIGIFREELAGAGLHWREPEFRIGNVGTVLFCVPNIPDKLGAWDRLGDDWRPTDWVFISTTAERMGEPVMVDEVIARQRPNGMFSTPIDRLRFRMRLRARVRRRMGRAE